MVDASILNPVDAGLVGVSIKTISLLTICLVFTIRLQAKATKKPYEVKSDFENFLHQLVSWLFCFVLFFSENN